MKQGVLNLFHSNRLSAPGRRGRRCVACRRAFATATKSDSEPLAKRAAGPRERAVPLPDFPLRLRRGSACSRSSAEFPPATTPARAQTAHCGRRSDERPPPGARLRTRVATASQPQPNRIRSRERSGPQARESERSHCGRSSRARWSATARDPANAPFSAREPSGIGIREGRRWSGRRDSNPQPTAWKAVTLPLSYSRLPAWHSLPFQF